jgi:hypothetical protein
MNKKLILMLGMLTLIVITGCDGVGTSRPITDADVRVGEEGLTMEFTKNAPPEKVFEDSPFPIAVNLKNQGATNIEDTPVKYIDDQDRDVEGNVQGVVVFGFEKTFVDVELGEDSRQRIEIEGKSIFNPNGDDDFITITGNTKRIGAQSETQPSTILATACYPYKTVLGTSVCIDTDVYGIVRGEKVCKIKELNFIDGQGAPVSIIKVESRMLPQDDNKVQPHFILHIRNKGNGEVVKLSETVNACTSTSLDYKEFFNTIIVRATLSGTPLDCRINKDDPIPATSRLRDNEDVVRCTLVEEILNEDGTTKQVDLIDVSRGTYVAPLNIELEYGYTFTISKDIIIEKILTY